MTARVRSGCAGRLACASAVVLGAVLLLTSAPAQAKLARSFEGSFNGSDAPAGPFQIIVSDTSDDSGGSSNGDVYVAELTGSFEGLVEKFNAEGKYAGVEMTGAETPQSSLSLVSFSTFRSGSVAVDGSGGPNKGDLYVAATGAGVVDKFNEAGTFLCQITAKPASSRSTAEAAHECDSAKGSETPQGSVEPTGIAVDSSGNIYVVDAAEGHRVIDKFSPSGEYLSQIADPRITEPSSIALDPAGNLYLANFSSDIVKFDHNGAFVGVFNEEAPLSVGADRASGHILVGVSFPTERIAEHDASGNMLDWFGEGHVERPSVLAVGPTGRTYVAAGLTSGPVEMFGPVVVVPDVAVDSTEDQKTSATLTGSVDPAGGSEVTGCVFEYGATTAYGQTAPCQPAPPYTSPAGVSAHITGLAEGAIYHFRLAASNANGTDPGQDHVFGPPSVGDEIATAITNNATVHAEINPSGVDTTCQVQYVSEAEFQRSGYGGSVNVPCADAVGWEAGERSATAQLSGLRIDTTYHYRVIATSGAGVATGEDHVFATFGVKSFSFGAFDQTGQPYTQAGGHPYKLIDTFTLSTSTNQFGNPGTTDANPKDIRTELPPGLIGNPEATPKCSAYNVAHADCSGASQVGVLKIYTNKTPAGTASPIYNLIPPKGLAAQLGARFNNFVTVHIDARVRTGGDYGVTADVLNSSADEGVTGATVTLWGVPGDPSHDTERSCPQPEHVNEEPPCSERGPPIPFLTGPTSCSGPLRTTMSLDSWQEPDGFVAASSEMPAVTGCDRLDFKPTISLQPDTGATDSPTGLQVDLHVPQNANAVGLAEADLKNAVVTLPAGMTVNPAAANGLAGCSEAEIELHGPEPAGCPDASKIGSVELLTPLIDHPLNGSVYVAQQGNAGIAQGANEFGALLALYIAIDDPQTGVVVKLAGKVSADPLTGQLTTSFDENPQLPFEELKLDLFGGSRGSLITPSACGTYTMTTSLTPWSAPESGPPASPIDSFPISSRCTNGFAPSISAGTIINQAGAFSPFALTLARQDGEQRFSTVTTTMPPGLAAVLAQVPLCGEAQANAGTCSPNTQIGHVTVTAGAGPDPIALPEAGKPPDPVYLTGRYKDAPFGLSIVVPAEAGPFDLDENGHPIVVRAKIEVDPKTAQVSVVSDPMPTMVQGIPVDVRTVNVAIDRSGFVFNPTSCDAMQVAGTITSTQGAAVNVSSRFQAANCATLPFKPKFSVLTQGRTSKANGASLHVKVTSGPGQANIGKVKVDLPKQLPSRLTTLQKACPDATFNSNPASCPSGSLVGTATAVTPVLKNPLTGPAYLVAHAGAAFPDLVIVLQGEGITLDLVGNTDIKKGITISTFNSVPDAPILTFDLVLPSGPHSALGAYLPLKAKGSLCGQSLAMPTLITGQNGAVIKQTTKIEVAGCPKHKHSKRATARRRRKSGKR